MVAGIEPGPVSEETIILQTHGALQYYEV